MRFPERFRQSCVGFETGSLFLSKITKSRCKLTKEDVDIGAFSASSKINLEIRQKNTKKPPKSCRNLVGPVTAQKYRYEATSCRVDFCDSLTSGIRGAFSLRKSAPKRSKSGHFGKITNLSALQHHNDEVDQKSPPGF